LRRLPGTPAESEAPGALINILVACYYNKLMP
jgi:hypothetical protein